MHPARLTLIRTDDRTSQTTSVAFHFFNCRAQGRRVDIPTRPVPGISCRCSMETLLHGPFHIAPYFVNGLGPHCDGIGDSSGVYATLSEAITHANNMLHTRNEPWGTTCVYVDRPHGREILWERGPLPFSSREPGRKRMSFTNV
jgi:hypothetical protein